MRSEPAPHCLASHLDHRLGETRLLALEIKVRRRMDANAALWDGKPTSRFGPDDGDADASSRGHCRVGPNC